MDYENNLIKQKTAIDVDELIIEDILKIKHFREHEEFDMITVWKEILKNTSPKYSFKGFYEAI